MLSIITIVSDQSHLQDVFNSVNTPDYDLKYQGRINEMFPVIVKVDDKNVFIDAMWGVIDINNGLQNITQIDLSKTLKQRPFNLFLRKNRCVVPVNCFIGKSNNKTYVIKLLHDRLFCFGGFHIQNKKSKNYSFCIYETESTDILKPFIGDKMPVLFEVDQADKWLKNSSIHSLIKMADKSVYKYFDVFEVSNKILDNSANNRGLLKPIGKSLKEHLKERKTSAFEMEQFKKERGHRGK